MHEASIAVRMAARGLVDTHRSLAQSRNVLSPGPELPSTLRRGMALVSAVAMRDGYRVDIGSQINAFTVMACRPVRLWGPPTFAQCQERDAILVDTGYGVPTPDCFELAELGHEGNIVEDIFHERLRTALASLSAVSADTIYREVRADIVRRPLRRREEVLAFAHEHPELAGEIPGFFRPLPAAALDGHQLRVCAHCGSPLFPMAQRTAYPNGRCAVRECRMMYPEPEIGAVHTVAHPAEWRLADSSIMTYWVGPGLPEIKLYDILRAAREDVELYPLADAADIGIGGLDVGIDVKSYSSAAVLGQRFARDIGGLRAFKRRIVAIPDFWIEIDRDYIRTASMISGLRESIEIKAVSGIVAEFAH